MQASYEGLIRGELRTIKQVLQDRAGPGYKVSSHLQRPCEVWIFEMHVATEPSHSVAITIKDYRGTQVGAAHALHR